MRIKTKVRQSRRDFQAVYECEFCGVCVERYGYDDANFHENVIPYWPCSECGKTSEGKAYSAASIPAGLIL